METRNGHGVTIEGGAHGVLYTNKGYCYILHSTLIEGGRIQ